MDRNIIRQVLKHFRISGEIYRGYRLIRYERRKWGIRGTYRQFSTRKEARKWVNETIEECERRCYAAEHFIEELRQFDQVKEESTDRLIESVS